jgi:hypothetical protein
MTHQERPRTYRSARNVLHEQALFAREIDGRGDFGGYRAIDDLRTKYSERTRALSILRQAGKMDRA